MTERQIPLSRKEAPENHRWYFRFDLRAGIKGTPAIVSRAFEQPFSHPKWCGPFTCEEHAIAAAQDLFVDFINLPVVNARDKPF